jgi:hypothetical protein
MVWVARIVGVLALGFGALGLYMTWLGQGQDFPVPLWNEQPWSAEVRRAADWVSYGGLALGGLIMVLSSPRAGAALLAVVLLVIAIKTGYDAALGDPETARHQTMMTGNLILGGVAAVAFLVGLAAPNRPDARSLASAEGSQ